MKSSNISPVITPHQANAYSVLKVLKRFIRQAANIHIPDGSSNVFLFSVPRSGSTWLMELIWSQPGFKYCDEPLDLRNPLVRKHLGINTWNQLYSEESVAALHSYFQGFINGHLRFMNPHPLRRFSRILTRRIVFKILHGCEDKMNWFRDSFNGRIVYLIRHPIPVAISREEFPRLHAFLESDYSANFSREQLQFAKVVLDSGTKLQRGVVSWCLQNSVPLRKATDDWVILSYEHLVIDPSPSILYLAHKLNLTKPQRMLQRIHIPSAVKSKSDEDTQRLLSSASSAYRHHLVDKWRKSVSRTEERRLMDILKRFNISLYEDDNILPTKTFLHDSEGSA